MTITMTLALGIIALALTAESTAQGVPSADSEVFGLDGGPFSVGFQLLEEKDYSRTVTGGTQIAPHARPIRVYLWYPAKDSTRPMTFGDYAEAAQDDIWPAEIAGGLRGKLNFSRSPLSRSLSAEELENLLQKPLRATQGAQSAEGDFPLIVIGQGLYYESPLSFVALSEFLAGRGFVVATAPLVGTNSPLVKVDAQDLEAQVRDLEFVVGRVRKESSVSQDKLGVLGFDQGGMAGLILSMRNFDVDAFVSLDSGILYPHPSGLPSSSTSYNPLDLHVPWLHVTPPRGVAPPSDSNASSLMQTAIYADRYLLIADGMGHADFTSYALIEARRALANYWGDATVEREEKHRVMSGYIHDFFDAYLLLNPESMLALAKNPDEIIPGSGMSMQRFPTSPHLMGYPELVQAIISGKGSEAINRLRSQMGVAVASNPKEDELTRLAISLMYTWNLVEESIPLLVFTVELYPSSSPGMALLAEAYTLVGNYNEAINTLNKYLEQYPNDQGAKGRLEQIRSLAGN